MFSAAVNAEDDIIFGFFIDGICVSEIDVVILLFVDQVVDVDDANFGG